MVVILIAMLRLQRKPFELFLSRHIFFAPKPFWSIMDLSLHINHCQIMCQIQWDGK